MSNIPEVPVTSICDDAVMIDVREIEEWEAGHAPGAIHIPLGDLPSRLGDLPELDEIPIVCRSGGRSLRAAAWLQVQGFDATNVEGGMRAWYSAGKPMATGAGEPFVR